mmetsp:Transcript_20187/g.25581  ORF Transcript_20187/g.25581 Transcript_20187/m.25581 type:complete len:112 (-) Transcript_20187:2002-2337(-)
MRRLEHLLDTHHLEEFPSRFEILCVFHYSLNFIKAILAPSQCFAYIHHKTNEMSSVVSELRSGSFPQKNRIFRGIESKHRYCALQNRKALYVDDLKGEVTWHTKRLGKSRH